MLVTRSYIDQWGQKVTEEMTPENSSELSREGMTAEYPSYKQDPSYRWARDVRRKRKEEGR